MSAPRQIDLDSMSLEQLNQLKQSEEGRLSAITNHYATLRASSSRFASAQKALKEATDNASSNNNAKDIMIPLTESLYVPAKIQDPSKVMVELGTGFFVEKNVKHAHELLDRKTKLVDVNSENIMEAIASTRRNVESINDAMNGKMLEIRARQEGMKMRNAAAAAN
mmetsp:Transcript_6180/g.9372  ORF Transcript_6180/g.9372 Transcript_6180/m.9372 type:complete len:166 (-) Transcript_6180:163-660(-)